MSHHQKDLAIKTEAKAATVEAYKFEPIKGYPMLNWRGGRCQVFGRMLA